MALMIDVGDRCAMTSPKDCGLGGGSGAVSPLATACAASEDFAAAVTASAVARVAASGLAPEAAISLARFAASFASLANRWARSASTALSSGLMIPASETPIPGLVMLTAASPMNNAKVVTISK